MGIVVLNEVLDFSHQVFDTAESAATDGLLGDNVEPDFDLVKPRSVGLRVVHLKPGVRRQPAKHARMLVRGVVIHDQMHGELGRNLGVDLAQEVHVFLVAMAAMVWLLIPDALSRMFWPAAPNHGEAARPSYGL